MGFSGKWFTAISFCLASVVVQSFGELIVFRPPPTANGLKRNLTCVSEDDGAALSWNFNVELDGFADFQPKKSTSQNVSECAIWNSTRCLAEWEKTNGWDVVDSIMKPMAPALDYRWEGFREFVIDKFLNQQDYKYVGKVNKSSGSAVFSVRGLREAYIYLCTKKEPTKALCFWIVLGSSRGTQSAIRTCAKGAPKIDQSKQQEHCEDLHNVTHGQTDVVHTNEWHTFTLNWNKNEKLVQVFKDREDEPFLQGSANQWDDVSHISIRSEITTRFRFHFYEYFMSKKRDSVLHTKEFHQYNEDFCVQLLIGLCPECQLSLSLVDTNNQTLKMKIISGDDNSVDNKLLTWRLTKLSMNVGSKKIRLDVRTILKKRGGKGQWAIDSFRTCQSDGGLRESTVTITEQKLSGIPVPTSIYCQKLSYTNNAVVNPFSVITIGHNTTQLEQLVSTYMKSCSSSCMGFGNNVSICNPDGCMCDRGRKGKYCDEECTAGYHGYNCTEQCGSCDVKSCDAKTGYCGAHCKSNNLLPPLCVKELEPPIIEDITDTTARVLQHVRLEAGSKGRLYLRVEGLDYSEVALNGQISERVSSHKTNIENLKPGRTYVVSAVVSIDGYGNVSGRDKNFTTKSREPSPVQKLEIYGADLETKTISLRWLPPNPANGDIESYQVSIGQKNESVYQTKTVGVSEAASNCKIQEDYLCYRSLSLPPNFVANDIEVKVYAKNKNVEKPGAPSTIPFVPKLYFDVPSKPLNLTAESEAHGIVILKWSYRSNSTNKIVRFIIRVELLKTNLQENITAQFPMVKEYPASQKQENYIEKLYLPTSTVYKISVMAVNAINLNSSQAQVDISVGEGVAFASGHELQIRKNGTLINLTVPKVVNATQETTVSVKVKGSLTCTQKQSSLLPSNPTELVAIIYKPTKNKAENLSIDAKNIHNDVSNCSLDLEKTYDVTVVLKDSYSGVSANLAASELVLTDDKGQNLAWLIIFPIIAICVFLFVWYRYRKGVPVRESCANRFPLSIKKTCKEISSEELTVSFYGEHSTPSLDNTNCKINRLSNHVYAVPFVSASKSVSITCFGEYAKQAASSGLINSQYATFPRGLTRPCEYGRLPQNMPKNRNKNLIAYDDTRVILDKIPGDPYSDYINANYIQGYGEEAAYIATQGPKPNTVNDFWRMIWQQGVRVICMLTNVVENGQKMCEQYWPEVGTEATHGNITVSNTEHQVFADYTLRTFEVTNEEETRTVKHLHYTGWPNHGVPMYSQSLVAYLKKLVETLDGHGPGVIHCSAGDGRTGTIILCDMCVRQSIIEREIEVPAVTRRMYDSRANMLDSPQQYLLAHMIIEESIISIPTQIPCTDVLPTRIKALRKQLTSHVQRLNGTVWQERALHSLDGSHGQIFELDLNQVSVEMDVYEQYSSFNSENNYINCVSVDGVRIKDQYLASRLPSPFGLPDFWRYIAERNIELVIILQRPDPNDPMTCDIMSSEPIFAPVPYIQVETKMSYNEGGLFVVDKLLLTDTSEETARPQSVTVLRCDGWECSGEGKRPAVTALISLWRASENVPRKAGLALVLCRDGVTGCGLYLAMSFLLERMAVERECDVISAVRAVRRSRPEFVQPLEQFEYLYDAAIKYFECFETYANFS